MYLRAHFKKAVVAGFAALALSGCSPAHDIGGPKAEGALKGVQTTETLPQSGAQVQRVTIPGSALKEGMKYQFNDVSVTIEGDVPANVTINGSNGQLRVTGNLGDNDRLDMQVPEYSHVVPEECSGMMYYGNNMWMPYTYDCSTSVDDGPKAPFDKDPAIVVEGQQGKNVRLTGSKGIFASNRP